MLLKKNNWEVKKLGEVCDIISGSTPKTNNPQYWDGDYYWVTPAELDGKKWISSTERTITDMGVKSAHLQLLPSGTVLLSSRAPIGKIAITTCPMYCNQGFKNLVCKNVILNEFVYWFLLFSTEYLKSLGTGATFKEISKKVVEQVDVPVPPLLEQYRIVEELDLLSNIIEKKRQQLSELDNLAQSIFYDMFGDPVTNEKGWEVKLIGEISTFHNGKAHEKNIVEYSGFLLVNAKFISSCGDIKKYSDMQLFPLYKNDITMVMSDLPNGKTLAKCYLIEKNDTYTLNQRICAFRGYKQNPIFLKYVLNRNKYYLSFDDGNGQTNLRKSDVVNCPIILPPLSLQQLFAKKIEAIEKQKALIKQSIVETEELFNSRMDYYFS